MRRTKTRLTPNQQAWKKEVNRLKRFIRNANKRGFIFPLDIIPSQPSRITEAALSRLRDLTPARMYSLGQYIDPETGEIRSGTKGRTLERSRAAKKRYKNPQGPKISTPGGGPNTSDALWKWIWGQIDSYDTGGSKALRDFMNRAQIMYGLDEIKSNLFKMKEETMAQVEIIALSSDREEVQGGIDRLEEIIKGAPLTFDEKLRNAVVGDSEGFDAGDLEEV